MRACGGAFLYRSQRQPEEDSPAFTSALKQGNEVLLRALKTPREGNTRFMAMRLAGESPNGERPTERDALAVHLVAWDAAQGGMTKLRDVAKKARGEGPPAGRGGERAEKPARSCVRRDQSPWRARIG